MAFSAKKLKKLGTGVKEDVDAMSKTDLEKTIIECENLVLEQEKLRDNDSKLAELKEMLKDLSGGYRDAMGAQRAKIDYCVYCLNGGSAGEEE